MRTTRRYLFTAFQVALVSYCFISCSTTGGPVGTGPNVALVDRLKNRGPVVLSSENPFLAGNLLVSKEVERSEELRGFIKHRGSPAAIEVSKEFFSPLTLLFFYPEHREQYTLELADGTWVIAGPVTMEREKMKAVLALLRGQGNKIAGAASLEPPVDGSTSSRDHGTISPDHTTSGPESGTSTRGSDLFLERLEQATKGSEFKSPASADEELALPAESPRQTSTEGRSSEAQAIATLAKEFGKENAEISPQGDLVHYVTYSGETLSMIARWYTYDRANADKLARINSLKNPHVLSIGDMVVIPSYLLKNKSRMSEAAVRELSR